MRICSHIYALVILRTKLLKNFDIAKSSTDILTKFSILRPISPYVHRISFKFTHFPNNLDDKLGQSNLS